MPDLVIVAILAIVWWVPTFRALAHLQRHLGKVSRLMFWRWSAMLCVPIVGALLYFRRGKAEVEEAAAQAANARGGQNGGGRRG